MPELPEVETVRLSLESHIVGRTITGLQVGAFPGVLGSDDPDAVLARLRGRQITRLRRRAKYLIADLDDGTALLVHLRMTGSLGHHERDAPAVRFEHLAIELDDGTDLRFADQRKFGRVLHVQPGTIDALDRRLGPEPLGRGFTARVLADRLKRRTGRLKSILLDQSFVAGLGNIYVDEALFRAGLHPLRAANSLTDREVEKLHRAIRDVLREGLTNRGTSFSSFRDGYGRSGGNQNNLRIYGRTKSGEPCLTCGGPLTRIVVGGRGTHLCLQCQPELAPVELTS